MKKLFNSERNNIQALVTGICEISPGVGVFGGGIDGINMGSELVGIFEVCIGDTGLEVGVVAGGGVEGGCVIGRGGVQAGSVVIPGSGLGRVLGEIWDGNDALIGSLLVGHPRSRLSQDT